MSKDLIRKQIKGTLNMLDKPKKAILLNNHLKDQLIHIILLSNNKYSVCFDYNPMFNVLQEYKTYTKHNLIDILEKYWSEE